MAVGGDISSLGIDDLHDVKTELKEFNKPEWRKFGSEAGLSYITLNIIEASKTDVEDRFEECLAYWLRRKDNVDDKGKPSWRRLAEILEELGERTLAEEIRSRKYVSSNVYEEQSVTTSSHSICLPNFVETEYLQMMAEFSSILAHFVIQVFKRKDELKAVKMLLISFSPHNRKEIDEVVDATGLMVVLRNYCSLSKLQILTSLAEYMKMPDIVYELNQLEEKRERLYKEILAKDFAKSAIKYCDTTGSREATFEVLWPIDVTILGELQQFLAAVFHSQNIFIGIQLKTVHK